jgi:hypothetical protein
VWEAITIRYFSTLLENYTFEPSPGSRLHRHMHKHILEDVKKIISGKILPDRHWMLPCCQLTVASVRAM